MWIFLLILVLVGVLAAMLWYYHQQESVWQDELRGIHTTRNTSSAPIEKTKSTKIQPESIPEKKSTPKDTPVTPNTSTGSLNAPEIHENVITFSLESTLPESTAITAQPKTQIIIDTTEALPELRYDESTPPVESQKKQPIEKIEKNEKRPTNKSSITQLKNTPPAFNNIEEVNPFFAKQPVAKIEDYQSPVPAEQLNSFAFELIDDEPLPVITLEEATRNLQKYYEDDEKPNEIPNNEMTDSNDAHVIPETEIQAAIESKEKKDKIATIDAPAENMPLPLSQPDPDLEVITLADAMRAWQDDEPSISTMQPENDIFPKEELTYEDAINAMAQRERNAQHVPFPSPKPLPADTETISEDEIRESLLRQRLARRQQLLAEAPVHSILRNTIPEEEALANLARIDANAPAARRRRQKTSVPTRADQLINPNVAQDTPVILPPAQPRSVVTTPAYIRAKNTTQHAITHTQPRITRLPQTAPIAQTTPMAMMEPLAVPPLQIPAIVEQDIHFPPPAIVRHEHFQAASPVAYQPTPHDYTQPIHYEHQQAYYPAYKTYDETQPDNIELLDNPPAYPLPTTDLLLPAEHDISAVPSEQQLLDNGIIIEEKLAEYRVKVKVIDSYAGPVITRYEIEPDTGVRGNSVLNLEKDLARGLGMASIRVVETIPGKNCMGIELPNPKRQIIRISEIFAAPEFTQSRSKLTLALGQDITGKPVVTDLAKAPHLLVAGTTGSGKSVGVNSMILSLLFKATPEDVRLIMIDPKMLELSVYEGIPHLLSPVITDMKYAANALNWCVNEMEKRYRLMSHLGVRNLAGYNAKIAESYALNAPFTNPFSLNPDEPEPLEKLPSIVVVVDEFADLMMTAGKKIEELNARLAQKARAAGIHLILATQRPSVDVITGLIKANIPTRIAFQVSSKVDSRTILDQMGAENLLGQGDMLFLPPGTGYPQRVHGAFVADSEVHDIVQYLKQFGEPQYVEDILTGGRELSGSLNFNGGSGERDALFDEAVATLLRTQKPTISSLQRYLRIGYNKAATLFDQMEAEGIVSPADSSGKRTILVNPNNVSDQ